MKPTTITFFGNFGTRNLGNEWTLQAIIQNAREYVPTARMNCICTNPQETSAAHGITAFGMSYRFGEALTLRTRRYRNPMIRLFRRLLFRMPLEVVEWLKAFRTLKGTTMLVMTGTGMLSDLGIGPLDLHYEILKWVVVARLRGCKVLFVSVGAGPLAHPLSRWIVKRALSLADYRSYRDRFSQRYLESIGFNASRDPVYPDLAFSLVTPETLVGPEGDRDSRFIGLGLMDYYGHDSSPQEGERIYQRYVERVTRFAVWLLQYGYSLRLLIGDLSYDRRVTRDLLGRLERTGLTFDPGRIIDEPISSTEQLYAQLAQTDMVVATRFHNVLAALMLNRPVIALAPHEKVRSLMAEVGLADYCQDASELDVPRLIEQFKGLRESAEILKAPLKKSTDGFRRALDEQYRYIFGDLLRAAAAPLTPYAREAELPSELPGRVGGRGG